MNIYLSPHHDDVCFSIGNLASRSGGEVVNLFTTSRYVAANVELPTDEVERVDVVSRMRAREDEAFAAAAGLTRMALGLREPRLIGHTPFDLSELSPEIDKLTADLIPLLMDRLPEEGDPHQVGLYCPMGVGAHRNHVSTLLAVRGAFGALRRRCTLHLYEDLHYASVAPVRAAGLQRAARVFGGFRLSPIVRPLDPNEAMRKLRWIGLYASQHAHAPRLADFTPASGAAAAPHEIVWRVSPPDEAQP